MAKVVISRENLREYPKTKASNKYYHKLAINKIPSENSMSATVKLLYAVMTDNKKTN